MSFNGELSELSEVDRFCYRMVRIPGYQARLKSMLFKATFDEKCAEVEQVRNSETALYFCNAYLYCQLNMDKS